MNVRAVLRSPFGGTVVRDVVGGRWAEPAETSTTTIGASQWALPGLVDAHAHLAAAELDPKPGDFEGAVVRAKEALAAGVTLILDKGWCDDTAVRVIDALSPEDRPDIEAAARMITNEGGYFQDFGREIDPGDIGGAVADGARSGRGWVKLIGDWPRRGLGATANFNEDELRCAVAAAEGAGARVAIHTMAPDVPSWAVAAGVHSIEHGLFLTEADLVTLGERGGMWVPTILRIETTMAQLGVDSTGGRLLAEGLRRIRALLPMAVEAGVHVLAGTDLVGAPGDVAVEALRLGEYGLSNLHLLDAVSASALRATGWDSAFTIGSPANAVLFSANPLDEPGVLVHPSAVMRMGRLL